jgi:hypothetical protein
MHQISALAFVAVCLAGCASSAQAPATSAAPAAVTMEEAKAALRNARRMWKDPDSIRDTRIGQPYSSGCWGHAEHWVQKVDACVCIATNAKNSLGGYTGSKPQVALIQNQSVLDLIDARSQDQCSTLVPWPEFDGRQRP